MIPRPGAGDVQQMAFRVVDFFQICVVGYRLDPRLQGHDLIIARHHSHGAKLQALGQMHRTDRHVTAGRFNVLVEHFARQPGMRDCRASPIEFHRRTDENPHFVRHHAGLAEVRQPCTHQAAFVCSVCQHANGRWRPVEGRNRADALFGVAVNIRECRTQQTIGLHSDLV